MGTLPFAPVGGALAVVSVAYELSIAPAIGFIALAGVAAEFCVIMLIYVDPAIDKRRRANPCLAGFDRRDYRRRSAECTSRGDDGSHHHCRPITDHVRWCHGLGSDASDCSSDARRHDHSA